MENASPEDSSTQLVDYLEGEIKKIEVIIWYMNSKLLFQGSGDQHPAGLPSCLKRNWEN